MDISLSIDPPAVSPERHFAIRFPVSKLGLRTEIKISAAGARNRVAGRNARRYCRLGERKRAPKQPYPGLMAKRRVGCKAARSADKFDCLC